MSERGLRVEAGEGTRLRVLKESLNHAVEKVLGTWKASVFAKCFPSLIPENEAALEAFRVSLTEIVRNAIYEDLKLLIDDDVTNSLEQLGVLVKNYVGPKDVEAWRPSGNPVADVRAHDAKVLQHEKQRLLETLSLEQKKSEEMLHQIKAGREQCHNNSLEIQKRLSVLSEVKDVCDAMPKDYMIAYSEGASSSFEEQ